MADSGGAVVGSLEGFLVFAPDGSLVGELVGLLLSIPDGDADSVLVLLPLLSLVAPEASVDRTEGVNEGGKVGSSDGLLVGDSERRSMRSSVGFGVGT